MSVLFIGIIYRIFGVRFIWFKGILIDNIGRNISINF